MPGPSRFCSKNERRFEQRVHQSGSGPGAGLGPGAGSAPGSWRGSESGSRPEPGLGPGPGSRAVVSVSGHLLEERAEATGRRRDSGTEDKCNAPDDGRHADRCCRKHTDAATPLRELLSEWYLNRLQVERGRCHDSGLRSEMPRVQGTAICRKQGLQPARTRRLIGREAGRRLGQPEPCPGTE